MASPITTNQKLKTYLEQDDGKRLADKDVLEYKDRLIKFFSLLIEIDRKENVTKTYEKR